MSITENVASCWQKLQKKFLILGDWVWLTLVHGVKIVSTTVWASRPCDSGLAPSLGLWSPWLSQTPSKFEVFVVMGAKLVLGGWPLKVRSIVHPHKQILKIAIFYIIFYYQKSKNCDLLYNIWAEERRLSQQWPNRLISGMLNMLLNHPEQYWKKKLKKYGRWWPISPKKVSISFYPFYGNKNILKLIFIPHNQNCKWFLEPLIIQNEL